MLVRIEPFGRTQANQLAGISRLTKRRNNVMKPVLRLCLENCACLLLALGGLHAQSSGTVVFVPLAQIGAGNKPGAMALADITRDGIPDLIAANQRSDTLTILHGIGNGFFQPLPTLTTAIAPSHVVTGDFDHDGRLDLAVADFASNNVSIFRGNGNGTFEFLTSLDATGPSFLAVADFNGDGKLDLAIAESTSNQVSIFLGNGNGTFHPLFTIGVGTAPDFLALADFNGDGKLDIAAANFGSNDISILLGNGNGTFQNPRYFDAGPAPASLALGDFNGDGLVDIAVANATGFSSSSISLLLSSGYGVFQPPRIFSAGSDASFLAAADFNLDGKLDLAVANTGSNTVSIFLGIGDGTFLAPLDFFSGTAPDWIIATDLNGDAKPDLLVANGGSNDVSVLLNYTAATPAPTIALPNIRSVANAASLASGPVAPGELITIFGSNLGPAQPSGLQLNPDGAVATTLVQTQAFFDGIPAPLLYDALGQVTAVVPFGVTGRASTQLAVVHNGQQSTAVSLPVADTAPALFTAASTGQGQAAVLNEDGSANSAGSPAAAGSIVVLYATGAGQTNPPGVDGAIATAPFATPLLPVTVSIDGNPARVVYAGAAPGLVSGVLQVNARIPGGTRSGAVPVVLQVGSAVSQPGVTIAVQ